MGIRFRTVLTLAVAITVLLAAPAGARVRSGLSILPDGDTPPTVHSVELLAPQRHNALLETDLIIDATDNDGISRYEYRWNSATYGSTQIAQVLDPTVSYAPARPESPYALELRAIDVHENASDWFPVWSGVTPRAPLVLVAGDSIASGYSRQWFTGDSTCRDDEMSYGSSVTSFVAARLPPAWEPSYVNIAWAGAGINAMMNGGADSCGTSHDGQVNQIQRLADANSWNVLVVTAGINSTNWTDVIVGLTRDTALSLTRDGDRRACDLALHDKWDIDEKAHLIETRTRTAAQALTSTTNARIIWTGYHDITGTEIAPLWTPIGEECAGEMSEAVAKLHDALRAGLTEDITWVEIDGSVATQSWAGWPHPNAEGQRAIANAVVQAMDR